MNLNSNITESSVSPQTSPNGEVLNITTSLGSIRKLPSPTNAITSDVTGQNKAPRSTKISRDRVDIGLIAGKWKAELDSWYKEEPETMKSSVFNLSKPLTTDIKEARAQGIHYVTMKFTGHTISFKLNIGPGTRVGKTELTKVRFFAILLRYLHEAAQREPDPESKGFMSSALVGRVEFDQGNPLFKYRFLLGEGFHLNHDLFRGEEHLFLLGCLLLDFLSCHSSKSPRYEECKNVKTFGEYVRSSAAKHGDTLLAAMRHSDVSWSSLNEKLPMLEEKAELFKIHPYGTPSINIRLRRALEALRKKI